MERRDCLIWSDQISSFTFYTNEKPLPISYNLNTTKKVSLRAKRATFISDFEWFCDEMRYGQINRIAFAYNFEYFMYPRHYVITKSGK